MQLTRDQLVEAYRAMQLIRTFENRVFDEGQAGRVPGSTHLYAGQEAVAVGVCMNLMDGDHIVSTHRGHGHSIAKGCDIAPMMAEILGREAGTCKGKGGSMHIADLDVGMLGANGIVGGGPPIACGAALSAKLNKTGFVSVAFTGDGAINQGATAESLNLAMVWELPLVFIVEDNGWGEATSSEFAIAGNIVKRAEGYGMLAREVDGLSFTDVYENSLEVISRAREGGGPALLHISTERFYGHYSGDVDTYRSEAHKKEQREQRDCLKRFRNTMLEAGLVSAEILDAIDREIHDDVEAAVRDGLAAQSPAEQHLTADVYVEAGK